MVSESAGAGSEFKIAVYIKVRDPTEDRLPSVSKYHKISGKWWTVEVTSRFVNFAALNNDARSNSCNICFLRRSRRAQINNSYSSFEKNIPRTFFSQKTPLTTSGCGNRRVTLVHQYAYPPTKGGLMRIFL